MLRKPRKKKNMIDPHARRFGVEIECGLPGGYQKAVEMFPYAWHEYDSEDEEPDFKSWSVGEDGTAVEIRTPVLQGEKGFTELRMAMDRIKEAGGYVTTMDGLHIHHDAPEFTANPEACLRLVNSWRNNQAAIYEMVSPRRRDGGPCPSWRDQNVQLLQDWVNGDSSWLRAARNDLNLASLSDHGSIEIRLHEGTLDADVAIAWIMFGQLFIHEVAQGLSPLKNAQTDEKLLVDIRLSDEARAILAAKKANNHITPQTSYRSRR